MGKSRRKVVTVKPVNTEADWEEMCARKVKNMKLFMNLIRIYKSILICVLKMLKIPKLFSSNKYF